ncbi:MAG: hypothetical protein M1825_004816 [Sarcosagium campestre]|nr:MAG: hypothetical protein M1825_004816 [Sarcosagium campestre]
MPTPLTTPAPVVRILMLHGYTQSGPLFRAKTRALEKTLLRHLRTSLKQPTLELDLLYPTGPLRVIQPSIAEAGSQEANQSKNDNSEYSSKNNEGGDSWAWWRKNAAGDVYEGIEQGLDAVADTLRSASGPVTGVVGFSQGAALAAMVAALLEPGREGKFASAVATTATSATNSIDGQQRHAKMPFLESFRDVLTAQQPPLKFAVSYCGFAAPAGGSYDAFYDGGLSTPVLHFLGTLDSVVEEERSLRLVSAVAQGESRLCRFVGGHFVPGGKREVGVLAGFMADCLHDGWVGSS